MATETGKKSYTLYIVAGIVVLLLLMHKKTASTGVAAGRATVLTGTGSTLAGVGALATGVGNLANAASTSGLIGAFSSAPADGSGDTSDYDYTN